MTIATDAESLGNKTAIVTGGAGGLGFAIVRQLLISSAKITVVDINQDRFEAAKEELNKHTTSPDQFTFVQADITSEDEVKRVIEEHVAKYGQLDILINNAGICDRFDPVGECDTALFNRVMAVNLTAPFMLSKYAIQKMLANSTPGGAILNVGSTAGLGGFRAGTAYTTSKHALVGLTKNTAAFYGKKGIRCNIIMPGSMQTNVSDAFKDGMNQEGYETVISTTTMMPPQIDTQKMSMLVQYLVSDAASVVNGAVVSADQGWLAF